MPLMLQNNSENTFFSKLQISAPLCTLAVFCMIFFSKYIAEQGLIPQSNKYLAFVILQILIFVIPCSFLAVFSKDARFSAYRIRKAHRGSASFVLISTLLLIVAVTLVKYICTILFKDANTQSVALEKSNIWFYILAVSLIPAIFEELFFRGVVFSLYEKKYGTVCAIITSSLLFALYHFSLPDFLTYFTAGIITGFVLYITNSVICAIFMHFISNTLNIFLNNAIFKFAKDGIGNTLVIILLLALLLLVLSLWLGKLQTIYYQKAILFSKQKQENTSSYGYTSSDYGFWSSMFYTAISPPFVLCIALFIIYIL